MPESKRRAGDTAGKPRGAQALLGAAIAMVGALATVHPTNALLVALSEVVPQLAVTLPPVITACGALLAALLFRAAWAAAADLGGGCGGRSQWGAASERGICWSRACAA